MNIEERKKQIELLITKYYYENDFLKGKSLDKFLNKAYEKFLYSNLTIADVEKEIVKAIERKKNMIQGVPSNTIQNVAQSPINNSNNSVDKATISHSGGYANSLAITTTALITFISIMIIYILFCIIF